MEQVDSGDLHLSRIRNVNAKELDISTEARESVKEEVILESPAHQQVIKIENKVRMVTSSENTSSSVVSVPVSLPIGSMITGTAFNVITPDQLPHFKQMLCVDNNGYISGSTVVGSVGPDLKTIVIQQQQQHIQHQQNNNHDGSGSNNSHDSNVTNENPQQATNSNMNWTEATKIEIFPIRCKTTNAELYRSKLGSGGRGRCVKYKEEWYTPSEFENVCGRGSSKDWKRSIKFGGKSLQSLIDDGALTPHATNCSCTVCCDDEAASGPVRLFTPYKRRKRNQGDQDFDSGKRKKNEASSIITENNNMFLAEENITSKDEPWPTLNDSLDTSTELVDQSNLGNTYERETFVVNINESNSHTVLDNNQTIKNLDNVYCTMVKATNDFKRLLTDIKNSYDRKIEVLQKERDAAVAAMRVQVHSEIEDPNITGSIHGNEIISAKKCANCNREALAECSLCRKTPYCSEFCQRKDWNAHQVECTRNPAQSTTQQIMLLVDEQS